MVTIYLWIWSFFVSILIFVLFFLYALYAGAIPSWRMLNSVAANTGIVVVILSFAIGNISYFFPVFTRLIKYRKEIGLTGFFIVVGHIFMALFFLQDLFPFPDSYLQGKALLSFSAAVLATLIISVMALISNTFAMKRLGQLWRKILRIGYVAVFLALIHMVLRETESWGLYAQNLLQPPPLSMIILWFGIYTIILRICVYFMTRKGHIQK